MLIDTLNLVTEKDLIRRLFNMMWTEFKGINKGMVLDREVGC
jgi:hypothetical protein